MINMIILAMTICSVLIILNQFISKKSNLDREKTSPFECGFDPKSSARIPFSLRFYLIAVMFLIFDVEITLILPIPLISTFMKNYFFMNICVFFILILILGLIHEWNNGALTWDN